MKTRSAALWNARVDVYKRQVRTTQSLIIASQTPISPRPCLLYTSVADTVMVAYVGEATVSGVSLVDSINMLIIQVFAALATGGAIVVAQYIGRGDRNRAKEAARQLFFVVTAIGVAVSLVCSIWRIELLRLVYKTVEPAVMEASQEYFLLIAASYPAFAIYNAGAALFRAQGNSRVSMMTALMMNILNIGGNAIFLFVFDMGAFAVGLGTMLGRVAGAAVMLWLIRKPGNLVSVEHFLPYRFEKKMVATILRIGVPDVYKRQRLRPHRLERTAGLPPICRKPAAETDFSSHESGGSNERSG